MSKIIKRLLIFFVAAIGFLSAGVFIILNEPLAQSFLIKYLNNHYINEKGINLNVQTISYNVILRTLNLKGVQIEDKEHPFVHHPIFTAENLSLKFNILSSYLSGRAVLDWVRVSGSHVNLDYDSLGNLILPSFFKQAQTNPEQTALPFGEGLAKYLGYLPKEISLRNADIELGAKESNNYQNIPIAQLNVFKITRIFENTISLKISTTIQNSKLLFPIFHKSINLQKLTAEGFLYQNGALEFQTLRVKSDLTNFESSLSAFIQKPLVLSTYKLNLKNSDISAEKFFGLFNLPATGSVNMIGNLSGNKLNDAPVITGDVQWQDIMLDGFNLYKGQGNIRFENLSLYYYNAEIQTPLGGKLFASGKYQFFDEFYFENNAHGEKIPLKELLDGVHAKQEIIDGILRSDHITATGHLRKNTDIQKEKFDVSIKASVNLTKLHLIPMKDNNNKTLPNILIDLNIRISDTGLVFDHTIGRMGNGTIMISQSHLTTKAPSANMSMMLVGTHLNLSFLEYFVQRKTTGELDFTGKFTFNAANPGIQFKSQIHAKNGSIDNIQFTTADGNLGLFENHLEISDLVIGTPSAEKVLATSATLPSNTYVNLSYFSLQYKDLYSKMIVNINGNLANILHALKTRVPQFASKFNGNITSLNFNMSGYLLHTNTWKFTFDTEIQPLVTSNGNLAYFSANLQCAAEECKQSKILLNGFDDVPGSSALVVLYDISFLKSNFAFQLENVPIEFFNYSNVNLKGKLYALGELQGTWKEPGGNIDLNIDHFTLNNNDMGQLSASYQSDEPKNPQFNLAAFNDQIRISLRIPFHNETENSKINLILSNFNIGRALPAFDGRNETIYSRINAHFSIQGKWDPNFRHGLGFLKKWTGSGSIDNSDFQIDSANFTFSSPKEILFQNDVLTFDRIIISSDFANISLNGDYDITTTKIFLRATAKGSLNNLNKTFYIVTESEGNINGEFGVTGTLRHPNFSGHMFIAAKKIAIRGDTPPFTDLEGSISLNDTLIEIQKLNAKKGVGTVSLTGTFDFKNIEEANFAFPITNLRLVTRNASFEVPIPIFRSLDLTLNSDITMTGQKPPFRVSGQADIIKLSVFRDLSCSEIYAEYKNLPKKEYDLESTPFAKLNVGVQAFNTISIQSTCLRAHVSTKDNFTVVGDTNLPLLEGGVQTENATFSILKARFNVKLAEFIFTPAQKFDPTVSIEMSTRIASYDIFWDANGRLSVANLNITAQPEYLPNGNPINAGAILFMITTGQIPTQDSVNTLLATGSGFYSYFGANNSFTNVIDQTLSTVTGGLFDTLSVSGINQNGVVGVRFAATRYFSQRLTFGMSYEGNETVTTSSAFFYYLLNRNIGFTGAFSASNAPAQTGGTIYEASGGLRFNFGTY